MEIADYALRMNFVLVQWYDRCQKIPIHEETTSKDLTTRCLYFLPPEARQLFHVWLIKNDGNEVQMKENEKFGDNLTSCKYIDLKHKSSDWIGLAARVRIQVSNALISDVQCHYVIYIDAENCCIPKQKNINDLLDRLKWIFKNIKVYIVGMPESVSKIRNQLDIHHDVNVEIIEVPKYAKIDRKLNAADVKINNLIFQNSADTSCRQVVVLISGDKDFASTMFILENNHGTPTVLVHKAGSDWDLTIWSSVTITYEDLCRGLPDPKKKINIKDINKRKCMTKSHQECHPTNQGVDENAGPSDLSGWNVNVKTRNMDVQENSAWMLHGADFQPARNVRLVFCNRDEILQIKPWDTVGVLKTQVSFLLVDGEGRDLIHTRISCLVNGYEPDDDENIFDLTREGMEIVFEIKSLLSVTQWTFIGKDFPLRCPAKPKSQNGSANILVWDLRSCPVPDTKNGLQMAKRIVDYFCHDNRIQSAHIFSDTEEDPDTDTLKMFYHVMNKTKCTEKSLPEEFKRKLLLLAKTMHNIIVITGDSELMKFVDELKRTRPNLLLISNRDSSPVAINYAYQDLTNDLPDKLQDIIDLRRKIVVKGNLEVKEVRRQLNLMVQQHRGIGKYINNIYQSTFQTENEAKNFQKLVDGSEFTQGSRVTAEFPQENSCFDRVQEMISKKTKSTPELMTSPPTADTCYKGDMNVIVKVSLEEDTQTADVTLND